MTEKLERILPTVQKPARYVGGEYGQTMKDKRSVELRVAFCFPDTYEIGMSNLGMRILYAVMNRMEGVWCERVFAPWGDMEDAMRANGLPLYALESGDPVSEFDLIAFTIGYEMSYTNVLNMLRLSGVPLHAADRTGLEHMVFAGGACVYNPSIFSPSARARRARRKFWSSIAAPNARAGADRNFSAPWRRSRACMCRRCTATSGTRTARWPRSPRWTARLRA